MRILSGLIVGFFSGFLLYMIVAMVFLTGPDGSQHLDANLLISFLGGGVLTAFVVTRNTKSAAKVWARGALIGASEWMIVGLASVIYSGKTLAETAKEGTSAAGQSGAALGAGLISMMGLGLSLFMSAICLVIWFIANKSKAEFSPDVVANLIPCPQCAERIQAAAIKCRFCGHILKTTPA